MSELFIPIKFNRFLNILHLYVEGFIMTACADESFRKCSRKVEEFLGYSFKELCEFPGDVWYHWSADPAESEADLGKIELISRDGNRAEIPCTRIQVTLQPEQESYWIYIMEGFHENVMREKNLNLLQQFSGDFMRNVNLGVLLVDMNFKLVDISDMACRILGVERNRILNRPLEEIFRDVPKEHQLVQRTLLDGLAVRNHAMSWTNNEERFELLMDSNLLTDEEGKPAGGYVIFKDVSNLRSLEEQVQRSDRLAMIGQIAAGTAHEIRNPLTSIKGFLQVLKKSLAEKGMVREQGYADIMLTEINRINGLVSEFLLLSKPRNSTYEKVSLNKVLNEIMPIIHNEAILHNVSVEYIPDEKIPEVIADHELLKQVFLNIAKNGIEAMGGAGNLIIREKTDRIANMVLVDIQDTGPGIPAFLIDKIFDPFFTTKDEGIGLGLSVCQRIIHDMGGNIRVRSKGFGTTFTISIPYHGTSDAVS